MEKVRKLTNWGGGEEKEASKENKEKENKEKEKDNKEKDKEKEKQEKDGSGAAASKEGGSRIGGFFATMRGGNKPEDVVLSAPTNPRHVGHVGWDAVNGFEVLGY